MVLQQKFGTAEARKRKIPGGKRGEGHRPKNHRDLQECREQGGDSECTEGGATRAASLSSRGELAREKNGNRVSDKNSRGNSNKNLKKKKAARTTFRKGGKYIGVDEKRPDS